MRRRVLNAETGPEAGEKIAGGDGQGGEGGGREGVAVDPVAGGAV